MYSLFWWGVASFIQYDFVVYPCCRLYLRNSSFLLITEKFFFYCKKQKFVLFPDFGY